MSVPAHTYVYHMHTSLCQERTIFSPPALGKFTTGPPPAFRAAACETTHTTRFDEHEGLTKEVSEDSHPRAVNHAHAIQMLQANRANTCLG